MYDVFSHTEYGMSIIKKRKQLLAAQLCFTLVSAHKTMSVMQVVCTADSCLQYLFKYKQAICWVRL